MNHTARFAIIAAGAAGLLFAATTTAPAHACPEPGGGSLPTFEETNPELFAFNGRGWGHGVGMSQYGARGAAVLGCDVDTILETYYQGTLVADDQVDGPIHVGLAPHTPTADAPTSSTVRQLDGQVTWRQNGTTVATQPAGTDWAVQIDGPDWVLTAGGSVQARMPATQPLTLPLDGQTTVKLAEKDRRYQHGHLRYDRVVDTDTFYLTAVIDDLDTYLYGLGEMPSSWPDAALQAQAIVGRSFAAINLNERRNRQAAGQDGWRDNCRCDVYDSVFSQAYVGFEKEAEGNGATSSERGHWGQQWADAVDATTGRFLTYNGQIASGNYAASHGGHGDSSAFVWNWDVDYLQAVDDSRWAEAGGFPHDAWTETFTPEELGERADVGVATDVDLGPNIGVGGRVGQLNQDSAVTITGTEGTAVLSGDQARRLLGLRSTRFTATAPTYDPPSGQVLVGDWNGDGTETLGWYDDGEVRLRPEIGNRFNDIVYTYGVPGDVAVAGDFNGDGQATVSVVRGAQWFINNRHEGGSANVRFIYGRAGDQPIVGDWNGDGRDTAGVVRGNRWLLRNTHDGGSSDIRFAYGRAGDQPIVGDWNGDGRDTAGVVRGRRWFVDNSHDGGRADRSFTYGRVGDHPLAGKFAGTDATTNAIERDGQLFVRTTLGSGSADERWPW